MTALRTILPPPPLLHPFCKPTGYHPTDRVTEPSAPGGENLRARRFSSEDADARCMCNGSERSLPSPPLLMLLARRPAHGDRVPEERIGDVRDVDHHPEALHLVDDAPADVREPAPVAVVARGAADRARDGPRERQVPGTPLVERTQVLEHLGLVSGQQR